jgi:hypothetical protein
MAKPFNDKKFGIGEPLATKLRDFCAANYKAPALDVIREALEEHIERRLQNPEMRQRYEKARRTRLALPEKIVNLVKKSEAP